MSSKAARLKQIAEIAERVHKLGSAFQHLSQADRDRVRLLALRPVAPARSAPAEDILNKPYDVTSDGQRCFHLAPELNKPYGL